MICLGDVLPEIVEIWAGFQNLVLDLRKTNNVAGKMEYYFIETDYNCVTVILH